MNMPIVMIQTRSHSDRKTHLGPPRPKYLECRESFYRLARRRPERSGTHRGGSGRTRTAKRETRAADRVHPVLKRAIRTLWLILDTTDRMWIPIEGSWRLNERHYGALQGLNKAQTVEKHGEAQVKLWRRSYDIPPPPLG